MAAFEGFLALAMVGSGRVDAGSVIITEITFRQGAFIQVLVAMLSREPAIALASVLAGDVIAGAFPVGAGPSGLAFVLQLASQTGSAGRTEAAEHGDSVDAGGTGGAGRGETFVRVPLAILAFESARTDTGVCSIGIDTRSSIATRGENIAFIHIQLAENTFVHLRTDAFPLVSLFQTDSSISTRRLRSLIRALSRLLGWQFTTGTTEPGTTGALEGSLLIDTFSIIVTGIFLAFIHVELAAIAPEVIGTDAGGRGSER